VLAVEAQARWEGTVRRGYADAGDSAAEVRDAALLASLVTAEEFPAVHAAMQAGAFAPGEGGDPFVFGLERILDGVDAFVAGRAPVVDRVAVDALEALASRDQKYKEAVKARREVEKKLREARKRERELLKAAKERLSR
jgi:hypothetical protein